MLHAKEDATFLLRNKKKADEVAESVICGACVRNGSRVVDLNDETKWITPKSTAKSIITVG